MSEWGFRLYNGFTGSGKTYRARARAVERARETGAPILVMMRERDDDNFGDFEEAPSLADACRRVWDEGRNTRVRCQSPEDVNKLCGVAIDQKFAILIVDGIWDCLRHPSVQPNVQEIVRAGRHYFLDLHGTSQMVGDFAKVAKSCALEVYQFAENDPDDLKQLEKRFGWKPAEVTALRKKTFLLWTRDDFWKKKIATEAKKSADPPPAPPPRKSRS